MDRASGIQLGKPGTGPVASEVRARKVPTLLVHPIMVLERPSTRITWDEKQTLGLVPEESLSVGLG
jgi:hypothetical protein